MKEPLELSVPFTDDNFRSVVQTFSLPAATEWAILDDTPHFYKHTFYTDKNVVGFTMRIPTRRITSMNMALSVSYDASTRITSALLIGLSDKQQGFINEQVSTHSKSSFHPLLLPTLLMCHYEFLLHNKVQELYGDVVSIETLTGQTSMPSPELNDALLEVDLGGRALTRSVLGIAQVAIPAESETQALIQRIALIRKGLEVIDRLDRNQPTLPQHPVEEIANTAAELLNYYLDCCDARANIALSDFVFLSKRADVLMNALYNYAAWDTAVATKRDSTSMKAIAVLTMFFLPATFFAAVFAMPVLDFSAPAGQSVIRDRFWIYCVLTASVTSLVLIIYYSYGLLHKKREDKRKIAAFQEGRNDIRSPPASPGTQSTGEKGESTDSELFCWAKRPWQCNRKRQAGGDV
ncbi:hypothetical protein H9L39_19955 [Fusarium oxysporum f. sp. albedinis]|nr:hypothetical protein H9L39_19955 [Fusarium oxysporum f. sp. albedinis]